MVVTAISQIMQQAYLIKKEADEVKSLIKINASTTQIEIFLFGLIHRIEEILREDEKFPPQAPYYQNNLIGRFVACKILHEEMTEVARCIQTVTLGQLFPNLLSNKDQILERLSQRISFLQKALFSKGRIPIYYESTVDSLVGRMKAQMGNAEGMKKKKVEKELYHLLLDKEDDMDGINVKDLNGSWGVCSIISFLEVLDGYLKAIHSIKSLGTITKFKQALEKALPLAAKAYVIASFVESKSSPIKEEASLDYYNQLASIIPIINEIPGLAEKLMYSSDDQLKTLSTGLPSDKLSQLSQFKQKSVVDPMNSNQLPLSFLLHDLTWDVLTRVRELKRNQFCFIPCGIWGHFMFIEIEFVFFSANNQPVFTYRLFNTGLGINHHEQIEKGKVKYVQPLTVMNLLIEDLSYEFFYELLSLKFNQKGTIDNFYEIQRRHLEQKANRLIHRDFGKEHPIQLKGTCTYAAIQMCFEQRVEMNTVKAVQQVKAKLVIPKQKEVIRKRKLRLENPTGKQPTAKKPRTEDELRKALEQSQKLLKLSEKFLPTPTPMET